MSDYHVLGKAEATGRIILIIFFWMVAAGSAASSEFQICLPATVLGGVCIAYPDFKKKGRVAVYWWIVGPGLALVLFLLYMGGLTNA
ncbi:hypothetical protein K8B33_07900 [Alcanivorax sp. JB21]|uniref:hypothetical protein n=1 Tax=Alcanivorax limicola TaxID=2874102 RepID=UPI001CC1017D|nr:hypothetical protein [Alcanivorax limicola]MBZ2189016.1 hypothetical protein [Alcanivorax limicola]